MKHLQIFACVLLGLALQPALARPPSYNYTELAFIDGEFRLGGSASSSWYQNGFQVDGSYALDNRLWLSATYSGVSSDTTAAIPASLRSNTGILRAGYIFRPAEAISIDVAALWRFDDNTQPLTNNEGPGASLGVRAALGVFEVFGRGAYLAGDFDGGYSVNAGALWNWTENFALSAGYRLTQYEPSVGTTTYNIEYVNVGIRFTFPTPL